MATIKIKRGTTDPTASQVTNAGELAANTSTPKVFLKTADDSVTSPVWIGAQIETSPSDWTSAVKLATQSAINTTFMPKSGGAFTSDVTLNAQSDLRFADSDSSNYVAFQSPATVAANVVWTLPSADGSNGHVLTTNGSGTLSWAAASATAVTTTSDNTSATRYLVMSTSAQAGATLYVDDTTTPLSYNPNTTVMNVGSVVVTGSGNGNVKANTLQTLANDQALTLSSGGSDTSASITITGAATPASTVSIDATTVTVNGTLTMGGASASIELPTTFTIGDSATVSNTLNIQTGATANLATKTINIGTGGAAGSTTNINLGSANGGTVTVNKDLVVSGNLTINGTTTTINSTTLSVDDKNIVLADGAITDAAADGGGITLSGLTQKTFNWVDATDAWTSSEHMNLLTGKAYYINGNSVLSSTALGSGVTSSSLTSVGTITTGVWNGTDIALADGGTNASLTAVNGGIVYSTASAMAITSAGTSNQVLLSGGAGAPTWANQSSLSVGSASTATTATTATNIVATEQTTGTMYLVGVSGASSSTGLLVDATAQSSLVALSYNNATATLTTYKVEAIVDGGTY